MDAKRKAIVAVAAGSALGITGLAITALPASAGEAPVLPPVAAESLVQSVTAAKTPALSGKVEVTNNLGLPALAMAPGASALNVDSADVYNDGNGGSKVSLHQGSSQETITANGTTVWTYASQNNTATKYTIPDEVTKQKAQADPTAMASQLLAKAKESSTVSVDGTARIAGRAAYELVLTPKPTERTLLREIRVAVDSETKTPLQLEVLTNGTSDPALRIGFSEINFAQQPADEFAFTPPKNAKIIEKTQPKIDATTQGDLTQAEQNTKIVGDGWDTVITGKIPADLSAKSSAGQQGSAGQGSADQQSSAGQSSAGQGKGSDIQSLLNRFGKPASGAWGSGHVFTTKVGTAIVTDDGRFAAGAVPEQVLFEALAAK
jgi:outer membrane lipoprotein-sorting protein